MNYWWCTDYDDKQLETRMTNFENWAKTLTPEILLQFIYYPAYYCPIPREDCFSTRDCFSKKCGAIFKAWGEKEIEEC